MGYYKSITEDAGPAETFELFGKPQITLNEWCQSQAKVELNKVT
jgi:hypothetical protein